MWLNMECENFIHLADFSMKTLLNQTFINFMILFKYSINFEFPKNVDNLTKKVYK